MSEPSGKESQINAHFRREGVMPGVLTIAMMLVAVVMAFVGPWLFERL